MLANYNGNLMARKAADRGTIVKRMMTKIKHEIERGDRMIEKMVDQRMMTTTLITVKEHQNGKSNNH